jgi:TetR/AcrR family transcriptional repressor of nem operon
MARVSATEKARTRQRIVETASRRFRAEGTGNVGVADLMESAGLTHGGFYRHFESKDALIAEVAQTAFAESAQQFADSASRSGLAGIVEMFLATAHRDAPDGGCPSVSLSADVARSDRRLQRAYGDGIRALLATIRSALTDDDDPEALNREAMSVLAELVGAITIARATAANDPDLSLEALAAARDAIMARHIAPANATDGHQGLAPERH